MTSRRIAEAVFLDTQVFEAASFNFESAPFAALAKHLETGRLRLVLTDITVAEVRAHIVEAVDRELKAHRAFRQQARVLRSAGVEAALGELDAAAAVKSVSGAFDAFIAHAEVVGTRDLKAGPVFEKYFSGAAPFGSTKDKKHEFPDSFVIQALITWTEGFKEDLLVVSGDDLFRDGCAACQALHPKSDLAAVLDHVASDDEKLAAFIRQQLISRADEIAAKAKARFEQLDFSIEDEWGDVEVCATKVTLSGDPEIIDISGKEASAHMSFTAEYFANLFFEDSSTGTYDKEDGPLFRDHVEEGTVASEELVVQVEVAFDRTDPKAFQVTDIILIEPRRGRRFRTSRWDGSPWK
jgi:PIN domain-containing protein